MNLKFEVNTENQGDIKAALKVLRVLVESTQLSAESENKPDISELDNAPVIKPDKKKVKPKTESTPQPTQPEVEETEEAEETENISLKDIRDLVTDKVKAYRTEIVEKLGEFKAKNVGQLNEKYFADFYSFLNDLD